MSDLQELRAHSLPRAFLCPASVRRVVLPISTDDYPARLGRAVHHILRTLAETGQIAWSEVAPTADRFSVNVSEVSMLCGCASKLWPSIGPSFVEPLTEVPLCVEIRPGVLLSGHADVISIYGNAARVLDWKSGRKDHDYAQQMRGYAALALLEDPELESATATIVWLREGEIETYTLTRESLRAWVDGLCDEIVEWDGQYHPGAHCLMCPRSHECDAANALLRRDVAMIADHSLVARVENDLASMPPAEIISLLQKADLVAHLAGRIRQAIKAQVLANGEIVAGPVKLCVERTEKRELLPLEAWPILEAVGLTSAELAGCMDLYVSRIESLVAKKAGRGKGAAAVRDLATKLGEAKAVAIRETLSLKEKRT